MSLGPGKKLNVERLDTIESVMDLRDAWRALEPHLPEFPGLTFDWFLSSWEHRSTHDLAMRDELFVLSFSNEQGVLIGIAPMVLTVHSAGRSHPAIERQLSILSLSRGVAVCNAARVTTGSSIAVPDCHRVAVYSALFEFLERRARDWGWLKLTQVPRGHDFNHVIAACPCHIEWIGDSSSSVPPPSSVLRHFNPHGESERRWLSYCALLTSANLIPEFRVLTLLREVRPGLGDFFRLRRADADSRSMDEPEDAFASTRARGFLEGLCQRLARRSSLRIFQLLLQGNVVATRIAFVCNERLHLYFGGHDPTYDRYRVAKMLMREILRYSVAGEFQIASGAKASGLSSVEVPVGEIPSGDIIVFSPTLNGAPSNERTQWISALVEAAELVAEPELQAKSGAK